MFQTSRALIAGVLAIGAVSVVQAQKPVYAHFMVRTHGFPKVELLMLTIDNRLALLRTILWKTGK
jgi:hypothetical protein